MEAGAIVGIVLGSVALLLIVAFLVYWYWWKPHHNKTRHAAGPLEDTFDERTRHRLMATYGVTGDLDGPDAQMMVDEPGAGGGGGAEDNGNGNDDNLSMEGTPYAWDQPSDE